MTQSMEVDREVKVHVFFFISLGNMLNVEFFFCHCQDFTATLLYPPSVACVFFDNEHYI